MKKYLAIFKISWANGFVYRLNFVMWRFRVVLQLLTVYFFWAAVYSHQTSAFGYSSAQMLTYILGTSIMRSVVMSSRSIDAQGEIASGDLNNYLVKPLNYFGYWFSRDISDKILNILFSFIEIALIIILLKPGVTIPSNLILIPIALLMSGLSLLLYFFFSFIISATTFWMPEGNGWAQRFLIWTILDFFSGSFFPLDILPQTLRQIAVFLPTTYFFYTPIQTYLGKFNTLQIIQSFVIMIIYLFILSYIANTLFKKGLKIYGAYGR